MAGWRIGSLVANAEIIKTVLKFKSNMDSGMYKPLQMAAIKALSMGREWSKRLNSVYQERRKVVFQIMDLIDAKYEHDTAGLFVWGYIGHRTSDEVCDQLLYDGKVFITPGHIFGSNGEGYVRISLCNSLEILEESRNRVQRLVKDKIKTI